MNNKLKDVVYETLTKTYANHSTSGKDLDSSLYHFDMNENVI